MKDILEKDPREANLPKWAQGTLADLRKTVTIERTRADEARIALAPVTSDTIIDPYDPIPVPSGQTVRLVPGNPDRMEYIDFRVQGGTVRVISGSPGLRVLPLASNHLVLEVGK